ncbi:type I restriction modification DNA specificity domain protein [Streptococcus cristatus ATCC 51100]|nr:restriction endonuclease subunit S [Streptococcus cristatus]EFX52640.1 type I restriction modification DNA specificity domain protein [Streptococcus cristatus ATCC 51100]KJQ61565.1 type I restriction-modification system, specificity protein [Streptococcus cristatus]SQG31579.1 DNA specificity domain-containing restriction modification system protein [Streptococcus cristatus ATCC 51100]
MVKIKLGDVIDFKNGKSIKKSDGNIPIYGGNGILGYTDKSNFSHTIVVGRVGAYCGSIHVEENLCWVSDNAIAGIPKEGQDLTYLYYVLKSLNLNSKQIGSSQPLITQSMLKDMVVDVEIDNEKQKRIAKSILIIDQKIQINNQINQELEAMAKTLYDYWFVQFDFPDQNGKPYKSSGGKMVYNPELKREIPEGWGVEKLKDKLSVSRGISYKTENIKDNIGTPMINLASIDINRNYKSTGLKYFNGEYLKEKIVSGGDLLIACTDLTRNADIVGSPIIVPFDEQKYVFSMDLAKIDSKVDFINKYYLYSTLRTEHYHNYIKKWASGTNVLHLNLDGMNWYSISVPPIELQEEYSQIILNFSKKTNKNIQENQELTQLRDWLLPMLMNGQVKVE